jgi:hypothetical protein
MHSFHDNTAAVIGCKILHNIWHRTENFSQEEYFSKSMVKRIVSHTVFPPEFANNIDLEEF